jgi:hypothetical protein
MLTLLRNYVIPSIMLLAIVESITMVATPVIAEESWKETFEEICGQVQGAESMSDQQIAAMIEKADTLVPFIQVSVNPGKKVILLRLKRCRGVYEFLLDTRKK